MSTEIVFETHSWSTDNERGIATGWLGGQLSDLGRESARALGERRRDDGVDTVYSSDLARAVETAEIAFDGSGIPVHLDARLRECDYGRLNGEPVEQVTAVRLKHVDDPFPDGQSYRQVVDGMRSFLAEIVTKHRGGRVVVIGHSATRWALEHLVEGMPLEDLVEAPFSWREGWLYVVD